MDAITAPVVGPSVPAPRLAERRRTLAVSAVIILEPSSRGAPADLPGGFVRGWLLDRFREIDASLAGELHDQSRHKAFTVSPLRPLSTKPPSETRACWFRITSLETALSTWLSRLDARRLGSIRLGQSQFEGLRATVDPSDHQWACAHWLDDLWAGTEKDHVHDAVRLQFHTPTAFSGTRGNLLFPDPRLVFESLTRKWNKYGGHRLDDQTLGQLCGRLCIEWFDIKPVVTRVKGYEEKAFVGYADYSIGRDAPRELRRILTALAGFSFYAGVGARTAFGLGQTTASPVPPTTPRSPK